MQINSLLQDVIKQIVSEVDLLNSRGIDLGEILTARIKAVAGDNVLIHFQGRDIPAKTMVPLEAGEMITFQFQGMQQCKAIFKLVSDNLPESERSQEFIAKILNSLQLPETEANHEIVKQMLQMQIPIDKKQFTQLSNIIRNIGLPPQDIGKAIYLFAQEIPVNKENIGYLQAFSEDNLNVFNELENIKTMVENTPNLPPNIKSNINALLDKINELQISLQDSSDEVAAKLDKSLIWQLPQEANEFQGPDLANPKTIFQNTDTNKILLTPELTDMPVSPKTNADNSSEVSTTINPMDIKSKNNDSEPQSLPNQPIKDQAEESLVFTKEVLQNKLEFLASKTMNEPEKLNFFLSSLKEVLTNQTEEIIQLAKNINEMLEQANPQEHNLKKAINDIVNKTNFIENLIAKAPTNDNQQIIYFSQTIINDNNANQTPVNIIIKRPKEDKGKKINFDNCTLTVSLNTISLGLVKATVKKLERNLSCQITVGDQKISDLLTPTLPQLADNLEKLNYKVTLTPIKVESKKTPQISLGNEKIHNLFNLDIRI